MFTFEVSEPPQPAVQRGHYGGWEKHIHVFYTNPEKGFNKYLVARINTSQGYCCGYSTIEYLYCMATNPTLGTEAENFWKALKDFFWPPRPDGIREYRTHTPGHKLFPTGQLFHINSDKLEQTELFKKGNGKRVHSYQSASERYHLTHLYQFDLC